MQINKYCDEYNIRSYECDSNGNLRILTLMNIFQDMADNHARELGLGIDYVLSKGLAWVGTNYAMDIVRLPKMHEHIKIITWPSAERRLGAVRDFEVFGEHGKSIIKASSQWVLIDFKRKRPVSLNENLPEYTCIPERALETDFPKLPEVERIDEETKFRVRFDDVDINKHVNNAVYVLWACEAVNPEFRVAHYPKHIEISFRKEGHMGEKIKVSTQCEGLHSFHTIRTYDSDDERELARAYIEWE